MKSVRKSSDMKMHEVSILYKRPVLDDMPSIKSSQMANEIIHEVVKIQKISLDYKEHFFCFYLTNSNNVLCYSEIGIGNSTGVVVNTSEIFVTALNVSATAIIVFHNHPSGTIKPSVQDKEITNNLRVLGDFHSIKLLDHLIITSQKAFYSFADEGKLVDNEIPF